MYKWVGDLYELRENIICTLNEDGQLGKYSEPGRYSGKMEKK